MAAARAAAAARRAAAAAATATATLAVIARRNLIEGSLGGATATAGARSSSSSSSSQLRRHPEGVAAAATTAAAQGAPHGDHGDHGDQPATPQPQPQPLPPIAPAAAPAAALEAPWADASWASAPVRPHRARSARDILNSLAVFHLCAAPPIVAAAPAAIAAASSVGLSAPLNALLKATFFRHFCGGENLAEVLPTMKSFEQAGIGSILDLAMESDINGPSLVGIPARDHARSIVSLFKQSIDIASHQADSLIAVKLTALFPPALLQRWSNTLVAIRSAVQSAASSPSASINADQFVDAITKALPTLDAAAARSIFAAADLNRDGQADWIDIAAAVSVLAPEHFSAIARASASATSPHQEQLKLHQQLLTADDADTVSLILAEVNDMCAYARDKCVRMLIDAEQTYFQPAIDDITMGLCRKWNPAPSTPVAGDANTNVELAVPPTKGVHGPVVFNTYQMYLRDAYDRLVADVESARRHGHSFGVKLVRGAYMVSERTRAKELGLSDPIHPSLDATHAAYNAGVSYLIEAMARQPRTLDKVVKPLSLVVASHNRDSVRHATSLMRRHGVPALDGSVAFAQLMGMQDATSHALASNGFRAYKYIPYGPVHVTIPYLHRRAQENSAVLGAVGEDKRNLVTEIKIRLGLLRA